MSEQTVFAWNLLEDYKTENFIVSSSNSEAYNIITNWPNSWGVKPYDKALLLIGPKSSGKTFLTKIWPGSNHNEIYEDIDQIKNEEDLLHIFNICAEDNKYLLLTAAAKPQFKLPDLASRINSINKININQPDDKLIKLLIFKLFSNYSLIVNQDVINYLLHQLPRNFAYIENFIGYVNKQALTQKRRVTIPLIKECFTNYVNSLLVTKL